LNCFLCMVWNKALISFFWMWIFSCPNTIYWRDHLFPLAPLLKQLKTNVQTYFWVSILFHLCLFFKTLFCQYHAILIPRALQYTLKSRSIIPPVAIWRTVSWEQVVDMISHHPWKCWCIFLVNQTLSSLITVHSSESGINTDTTSSFDTQAPFKLFQLCPLYDKKAEICVLLFWCHFWAWL
jgi:hypothetical protein